MPANKKYLASPGQRILKISAGFIGGYMVTQGFHLVLALYWNIPNALITLSSLGFILWVVLLILAILSKNGWKIWGLYLLISLLFFVLIQLY